MRRIEKIGCDPRTPVVGVDVEPVELPMNAQHDAIRIGLIVEPLTTNVSKSNNRVQIRDQHLVLRIPPVRQISAQHSMPRVVSSRVEHRTVEKGIRHQASVGHLPRCDMRGGDIRSVTWLSWPNRQSHGPSLDEEAARSPRNLSTRHQLMTSGFVAPASGIRLFVSTASDLPVHCNASISPTGRNPFPGCGA